MTRQPTISIVLPIPTAAVVSRKHPKVSSSWKDYTWHRPIRGNFIVFHPTHIRPLIYSSILMTHTLKLQDFYCEKCNRKCRSETFVESNPTEASTFKLFIRGPSKCSWLPPQKKYSPGARKRTSLWESKKKTSIFLAAHNVVDRQEKARRGRRHRASNRGLLRFPKRSFNARCGQ